MVALYIISGILFLFLLSLFIKVTVSVSYVGDLQVKLKIFFIPIKIYPFGEKEAPEKKPVSRKKKPKAAEKQKPPKPKPPLKETLLLAKRLVYEILEKFGRYIRIEEYRVKVLVATDDMAKTGVLYGAVCGILGSISVMIDNVKRRTHRRDRIFTEVNADFLAEEPELFLSIGLSLRVWQLLSVGITAAKGLLKYNSLRKEKVNENEQRNAAQANN